MSERTVAEASGSFGGLMFIVGHLAIHAVVAVGFFVVAVGGVAGEFGIGVGGHGYGEEIFEGPRGVEVAVGSAGGLNRLVSTVITLEVDVYYIEISKRSSRRILFKIEGAMLEEGYMLIAELQEQSINSETDIR